MNGLKTKVVLALLISLGAITETRATSKDVKALLQAMPAGVPLSVVIPNAEDFDGRLGEAIKMFDPDGDPPGLVRELKNKLKIADWVDFSKPIGLSQSDFSDDNTAVIFAVAPKFSEKVKSLKNAKEEDGIWQLPFDEKTTVYAAAKGAYVVAGLQKESVVAALGGAENLGASIKSRIELLEGKQIFAEINLEPMRPMLLGQIMQLSAIAPMLAMGATSGSSADPAAISGLIMTGTEGLQKFAEQIAFIDLAVGIENATVSATLQPLFNDGSIKQYLSAQKTGDAFFDNISADSYMAAFVWNFPGKDSPFFNYVLGKIESASTMASPMMMGQPKTDEDKKAKAAKANQMKESIAVARKLYDAIQGMSAVFSYSGKTMQVMGDYRGDNTGELLTLLTESLAKANPIANLFGGGATFQESGSRKVGGVDVKEFAIQYDPGSASSTKAKQMYGENARFAAGAVDGHIRYCVGSEEAANAVFTGKSKKAFTTNPGLVAMMKSLPSKKNIVLALDPAGIAMMLGTMAGKPGDVPAAGKNAPPVGLSISLSGEARLDLYIPLTSIKPFLNSGGGGDGGPM